MKITLLTNSRNVVDMCSFLLSARFFSFRIQHPFLCGTSSHPNPANQCILPPVPTQPRPDRCLHLLPDPSEQPRRHAAQRGVTHPTLGFFLSETSKESALASWDHKTTQLQGCYQPCCSLREKPEEMKKSQQSRKSPRRVRSLVSGSSALP